jgi:hypothetical protein
MQKCRTTCSNQRPCLAKHNGCVGLLGLVAGFRCWAIRVKIGRTLVVRAQLAPSGRVEGRPPGKRLVPVRGVPCSHWTPQRRTLSIHRVVIPGLAARVPACMAMPGLPAPFQGRAPPFDKRGFRCTICLSSRGTACGDVARTSIILEAAQVPKGGYGSTNDPQELFQLVLSAIQSGPDATAAVPYRGF